MEEPEEKDDFYSIYIDCENCKEETNECFEIPMGTTIREFLKDKKCENCDCSLMQNNNGGI